MGQNQMPQMFQYQVWSSSAPYKLYTIDDFIDDVFTLGKSNQNKRENLTACGFLAGCVVGIQCVCMLTILYIEMFVTFDFDPSLVSRLITDSDLDHIKWMFGHKLVNNWATEL